MGVKVDLYKAYDSVRWDFLLSLLQAYHFPPSIIQIIKECTTTPTFSININGRDIGFFHSTRGLRQGCPLAPYLFILVMQYLTDLLKTEVDKKNLLLHHKCYDPLITNLHFVDNILFFCQANIKLVQTLRQVLETFSGDIGL